MLEEDENNIEANFFLLACHAFLAELYVNNGQNLKALGEAKNAYKYIKIGFDHIDDNPEFYFSSGIYNYYREKFPEENPFYKSFIWFFRSGDMAEGLRMLKQGAEHAVFTKAECLTYLFHIYLRYEDKPAQAIYYAKLLKEKYTNNLHYISNYVENSIRLGRYENIYSDIDRLLHSDKDYYRYQGEIFYGNYLEINEKDFANALKHYKIADQLGEKDEIRIPHYDSILFLGLGRINKAQGNIDLGNQYLKKSVKAAEYMAYRKDAHSLLDK
jgi:tetratricopeptide (TPR) repeat protein